MRTAGQRGVKIGGIDGDFTRSPASLDPDGRRAGQVHTFLLAVLAGLAISAPPGPLGALCMTRALRVGLRAGLVTGVSMAAGDALLGGAAAFGAHAIDAVPIWLRRGSAGLAALALFWIGVRTFRTAGALAAASTRPTWRTSAGTLLLSLSTPSTLPALLVLFASLGVNRPEPAVLGIFCGGSLWWLALCGLMQIVRDRAETMLPRIVHATAALQWLGASAAATFALFP
jgi:putative LysE/RhtB family amino acid efflux pump